MLSMGEDDLICDLAETYGILNYRELSPYLVATLSLGLSDNSRIKKKMSGQELSLQEMLLALTVDNLQILNWTKTKDAQHNKNKPKSLFKKLMHLDDENKDELLAFETPEEYEAYMQRFNKEINNG